MLFCGPAEGLAVVPSAGGRTRRRRGRSRPRRGSCTPRRARPSRSDDSGEMLRIPQIMRLLSMPWSVRVVQPAQHRLDHLRQLQLLARVQHRRVAHLHVAHVLRRRVGRQLVGHAVQRLLVLQHLQRQLEGLEVLDQAPGVAPEAHRLRQPLRRVRRQRHPLPLRQLDQRRDAHRAVEVHVQVGLRQPLDQRQRQLGHHSSLRYTSGRSTPMNGRLR
jgi:hypothetical protein